MTRQVHTSPGAAGTTYTPSLLGEVSRELRLLVRWPLLVGAAVLVVAPSALTLWLRAPSYLLLDELDLYELIQSLGVPLLFPLLAAAVAAVPFAAELRHRYLASTRSRVGVRRYLLAKALAGALMAFVVFALATAVPALVAFEIAPRAGWVVFHPEVQLNPLPLTERGTFTQAFAAGPWAYVALYSGWVGLNGAVYAVLPLLLLVLVRNPVLALTTPLLGYHLSSFAVAVARLETFSPVFTVFPSLVQQPLWTVLVPFAVLVALTAGLAVRVAATAADNPALS